jgi:hypothetical protein
MPLMQLNAEKITPIIASAAKTTFLPRTYVNQTFIGAIRSEFLHLPREPQTQISG